jgi:rubredoxin
VSARYMCPVCGYPSLREPPRTSSGGSYEICRSCGFEFGVSDDDLGFTYEQWRRNWMEAGMRWQSAGNSAPDGWDPIAQLAELLSR